MVDYHEKDVLGKLRHAIDHGIPAPYSRNQLEFAQGAIKVFLELSQEAITEIETLRFHVKFMGYACKKCGKFTQEGHRIVSGVTVVMFCPDCWTAQDPEAP